MLTQKAYSIRTVIRGKDRFGATIATWPYSVKDYMGDEVKHHSPVNLYLKNEELGDFSALYPTRNEAMAAIHEALPCLVNQEIRHYTGWHSDGDYVEAEAQLVEVGIGRDGGLLEDDEKVVYRGKVNEMRYCMSR